MDLLNLTKTFNTWLINNSESEITHSDSYSRFEIERMICEEDRAISLHDDNNCCVGKCSHKYCLDMIHSKDAQPHIFEFVAIGYGQKQNNKLLNFTYIDFIVTNR